MEADAGFVQDIGHAHQTRADLGSQTDPLGLAARKGARGPGQGKVIQSHVDEEHDPGPDLLQDLFPDHLLHLRKLQTVDELLKLHDGHIGGIKDIFSAHGHRQGFLFKPLSMAGGTGGDSHEGLVFRLAGLGKGFPVSAVHIFNESLKGHVVNAGAALPRIVDRHLFPLGPVDQDIVDLLGIILKGSIQVKMVFFGQGVQDRPGKASLLGAGLPAQDRNGPLLDA